MNVAARDFYVIAQDLLIFFWLLLEVNLARFILQKAIYVKGRLPEAVIQHIYINTLDL